MPTGTELQVVVVTPERAVLDQEADFVAVPMFDGELGVLPGRAPLIGRLGFGELRTVRGAETRRMYIDGGFVQVRDNVVTVLTQRAVPEESLSVSAAEAELQAALVPGKTPEEQEEQLLRQKRARSQLRMARKKEAGALA